ncbi:MAG TPA: MFS transporter [Polyangia bacterium]|nr:MFS transporter [Polyangia bacterium]
MARVCLLLFGAGWGANHFVPLLLVYRLRLGLTPIDLGTLFAVYALGLTPGLLVGGPLSDRRGRRAVVLPGALLSLGGTAVLAASDGRFGVLAAGRLVVGLGSGAVFGAGTAWAQDLSSGAPPGTGARRAAISLSCGFGAGPLIAACCAQWTAHPLLTPYIVQAIALAGAVAIAWMVPGGPRPIAAGTGTPPAEVARDAALVPARFFAELGVMAPWVFAFPAIAFVVLPAQVRGQLGGQAVLYAGVATAVCLGAGILVQPFARRRPVRDVAAAALAVGTLGLAVGRLAASAGSPPAVLVASALLGVGYGGCLIAGLRWVEATTPPEARGRVTGIFYLLTYLGFWAPALLAAITHYTGEGPTLWLMAALALVTAAVTAARPWRTDQPR